jgi:hypothetical protein
MSKPIPRDPITGLNRSGNGRGIGVASVPQPKKRGANADRTPLIPKLRTANSTTTNEGAAKVSPDKPLTEKQKAFVREWAKGETIISASARAGYNDGAAYAYRLVRMPNILKLYNEEKRKYEEASQMTRKKVMDGLLEGIEMAKLACEPASVITGWKTVGQMCGYFEPVARKLDINVTGSIELNRMNRLSDAELLRVIQQGATAELELLEHEAAAEEEDE